MIFATRRRTTGGSILLLVLIVSALAGCVAGTPPPAPATAATAAPVAGPSFAPETLKPAVALDEMAGHLYTSWQLWQVENYPLAAMHAGHTLGESLPQTEGALPAASADALKAALTAYQTAASAAGDQATVQQAYDSAIGAINTARQSLPAIDDIRFQAAVLREVVATVGKEYAEGVDAGKLANIAEYQDAFGFLSVVRERYDSLSAAVQERDAEGADEIVAALQEVNEAFPSVMPGEPLIAADVVAESVNEIRAELGKIFELTDAAALSTEDIIAQVRKMTQNAVDEYTAGKNDEAYEEAANAYLEGFEHLEGPLLEKDRELVTTLEGQFKELRDQIKAGAPLADVEAIAAAINENMDKTEALLK
ncbi:MAG: hypothetical protein KF753_01900 [Caldilineaceae bacterium]|nr:hypothetical protein [Caldilineaceae bacterium]